MRRYVLSRLAEQDLDAIATYTLERWGTKQAIRYIEGLRALCQQLTETPGMGRPSGEIRPGLYRMEGGSHVIFYRVQTNGITITRILHRKMLPEMRQE